MGKRKIEVFQHKIETGKLGDSKITEEQFSDNN